MLKFIREPPPQKRHQPTALYYPFFAGLKKRVALGYAWVQQLGLSFSKIDLATGTVKGSTNKQRPNLSPEYDKTTQGV